MDLYPEDLDARSSRYSRDHERDYFDRRDRFESLDYHGSYPPLPDEPLFGGPMSRPILPHPRGSLREPPLPGPPPEGPMPDGAIFLGEVVLIPANPYEPEPKRNEKPRTCRTIFVGSIPDTCTEKNLHDIFDKCGNIVEVRVSRGRNFGHVQFAVESSVERAMRLSGCLVRIDNSILQKDCSRIHVDYAQDKVDIEIKRRMQDNEMIPYNATNAGNISADLHRDDAFVFAAKNVISWLNRMSCDSDTASTIYGLIASINFHGRKVSKSIQDREEEEFEFRVKNTGFYKRLTSECDVILKVYESAIGGKPWNFLTKAQRKSIIQWKELATDIEDRLQTKLKEMGDRDKFEPPTKIPKLERSSSASVSAANEMEAKLERALREIQQLKTDREVAVDKKEKEILQLKTLLAKFKKNCPEEWEKALGVTKTEKMESSDSDGVVAMAMEETKEVIDGVSLDDLNTAMDKDGSEHSLASAAAAYAQIRKKVGSDGIMGLGLSEAEVAIVAVLAAFLTVHPLGAAIESITAYFQTFNSAYNSYYLESLLRRLPKVFQQQSGEGGGKWWFLGFQTCYATPASSDSKPEKTS